ncbi:MAG: DUF1080 domain-containing protein [Kiritimatiellaeota bacterium]|nr:DUF1080 domain-containing protein [Kiritimatiellota bacterium]
MMRKSSIIVGCGVTAASLFFAVVPLHAQDAAKPYVARWAITLPGGGAGWLGVEQKQDGQLSGSFLWGGGSPFGFETTAVKDGQLVLTRTHKIKRDGQDVKQIETFTAVADGDALSVVVRKNEEDGKEVSKVEFSGKKIPDLPPPPDLSKIRFGAPVKLVDNGMATFDGTWEVMNKGAFNGWSLKEGVLSNRVIGEDGKNKHGTNLKTVSNAFEDFRLTTEVNMAKDGNSGIYLRGIYEIQMADTHGKGVDCHNMGALYGRITPTVAAEKPAGEWQTVDITLCDRHVTVILNGQKIIDNQPVLGCTGGAITSDEFVPGPIYLQGDHTDVSYRNMVLTPIVK